MDEILQKLLQSELLSEETRAEISEQWTAAVEVFKTQVREETSMAVRAELAEQWIVERDELVTKVDSFVADALIKEMVELKADIERFRDLEAEYAEKLVEEKHKLAEEVASELDELVDKIEYEFDDAAPSTPVMFPSANWGSLASFGARAYPNTKKWYGTSGNSFVAVVEFGKDSVRARAGTRCITWPCWTPS